MAWAPDAKYWHRLWSVRFAVAGSVISVASVVFPGVLGFVNPLERPYTYAAVSTGFLLATLFARLIDQKDVPDA
jgi:hypothetical protein